jgi:cobalt-zinc-cadmium efflux system outer membrane protein
VPELWNLALANNPSLRQAAAGLEEARGRQVQAGKYPNPQATYEQEDLGTSRAPAGTIRIQVTQEIVTGGKRRLDMTLAGRSADAATLALVGQEFEVLTRIRRAYATFVGQLYVARVYDQVVTNLEQARQTTRKLVETVQTRPRTDLLRIDALLEEARINRRRSRINLLGAWRQLAAEVGTPDLPMPSRLRDLSEPASPWEEAAVRRQVLARHSELRQAAVEVERARLAVERARAEVVPNVTLGGGYSHNFAERDAGAIVSVQTRLPLWDRNQGAIRAAQARWAEAQARLEGTANRLDRRTAEAYARYQGAWVQLRRLQSGVLPNLRESLRLVQEGYARGAAQFTFLDVLTAQQALMDAETRLAQTRGDLWLAIADLQGLMQLGIGHDSPDP